MARVFILQGNNAGKSVVLMNRYKFIDGVLLEENDEAAKLMSPNLVGFYSCLSMDFEEYKAKREAAASAPKTPPQAAAKLAAKPAE